MHALTEIIPHFMGSFLFILFLLIHDMMYVRCHYFQVSFLKSSPTSLALTCLSSDKAASLYSVYTSSLTLHSSVNSNEAVTDSVGGLSDPRISSG